MFYAWFWWKLMFEVAVVTRKYMFWKKNFFENTVGIRTIVLILFKNIGNLENTHVFWTFLSFIEYQKDSNFVKTWFFADFEFQNLQNRPSLISGKNRGGACIFPYEEASKNMSVTGRDSGSSLRVSHRVEFGIQNRWGAPYRFVLGASNITKSILHRRYAFGCSMLQEVVKSS